MKMNGFLLVAVLFSAIMTVGCASNAETAGNSYRQVNVDEAKNMMDTEDDCVILDVRTQEEYDEGHIPGAIVLPHDTVNEKAAELLPNKEQLILVYCRSGNRSRQAAAALAELGYTNIVEFGGIIDWPYDIEK